MWRYPSRWGGAVKLRTMRRERNRQTGTLLALLNSSALRVPSVLPSPFFTETLPFLNNLITNFRFYWEPTLVCAG